jgi:hypothetical protein
MFVRSAALIRATTHVGSYAGLSSSAVVVVPVIKRVAPRIVPLVVVSYASVMPIASPMMPAPPKTSEPTDFESDSEPGVWTVVPNAGIRIPIRPRGDWVSVNHPRVVGRNIYDIGAGGFDLDR